MCMSINIITQFKTKPGRANDLIALIRRLLPESLAAARLRGSGSSGRTRTSPTTSSRHRRWASRRHYENYMAWRTKNGVTAQFNELLAGDCRFAISTTYRCIAGARRTRLAKNRITLHREVPKISTSDAPGG
jgi:quinol monooxygenase YgiN